MITWENSKPETNIEGQDTERSILAHQNTEQWQIRETKTQIEKQKHNTYKEGYNYRKTER